MAKASAQLPEINMWGSPLVLSLLHHTQSIQTPCLLYFQPYGEAFISFTLLLLGLYMDHCVLVPISTLVPCNLFIPYPQLE